MSKEQTPITAEEIEKAKEFYSNSDTANVYEIMAQFAKQEVEKAIKEDILPLMEEAVFVAHHLKGNPWCTVYNLQDKAEAIAKKYNLDPNKFLPKH